MTSLDDTSRSATSRDLARAWPSVASRLGNVRSPSAWASSRPSATAAASSGQVCLRRRGLPVTGSVPA